MNKAITTSYTNHPMSFIDKMLFVLQWFCLAVTGAFLGLTLLQQWMRGAWTMVGYQGSPWPLMLLSGGSALICWVFRAAKRAQREKKSAKWQYNILGSACVGLLIMCIGLLGLLASLG